MTGEKHIQEDMTKVCKILSTMEQKKWVVILVTSHNIRTKVLPVNISGEILKANRRKSFFIWHRVVSCYSLTVCGRSHPQEKGFSKRLTE